MAENNMGSLRDPAPLGASPSNEVRHELRQIVGKTKAGKLAPIMAVPFLGRESGLLSQRVSLELDPVAGRMLSQIYAEVTAVYVPIQACDLLANGETDENAGITEILRRKIMDKEVLFPLEVENELTKRMAIVPRSISGETKVSSIARIAHNAAVNYLRKSRYIYASEVEASNTAVTPSIISETVLDRFGGALDPDEHINGMVDLTLNSSQAPVRGITQTGNGVHNIGAAHAVKLGLESGKIRLERTDSGSPTVTVDFKRLDGNPSGTELDIYADLEAIEAGGMSLTDLYNAQRADQLVRQMRQIANANPQDGEDAVLRWVFGLSADGARYPFQIYRHRMPFAPSLQMAQDGTGMQDEVMITHAANVFQFSVPVPRTELGGVVITFLSVTPDEVIAQQPHPIFSDSWTAVNHASALMRLDPEPVQFRDLFADIQTAAEETETKFYIGANALKRTYVNAGFNRQVDPDTVENKTQMWQYAIPAGVTPENILYPEDLDQYPFLDQLAEICTYDVQTTAVIKTPMFFGPTPVEKLAIVDDAEILE